MLKKLLRIKIVRKIVCNTFISQKIVSRLYQKHFHVRQRKITKQKRVKRLKNTFDKRKYQNSQ